MDFNFMAYQWRRTDSIPTTKLSPSPSLGRSPSFSSWLGRTIEKTWSGNLGRRRPSAAAAGKRRKSGKFRSPAEGQGCWSTPRLVRCCGVKRDWSLEDPRKAVRGLQKFRR